MGNAKNLILYKLLMLVVLYVVAVACARHRERAVSPWRKAPPWALSTLLFLLWGMYLEEGVQLQATDTANPVYDKTFLSKLQLGPSCGFSCCGNLFP